MLPSLKEKQLMVLQLENKLMKIDSQEIFYQIKSK